MKKLLIFLLILFSSNVNAQIQVTHFNAGWNSANDVSWFMGLEDCKTIGHTDIAKDTEAQTKHKIKICCLSKPALRIKAFWAPIATIKESPKPNPARKVFIAISETLPHR